MSGGENKVFFYGNPIVSTRLFSRKHTMSVLVNLCFRENVFFVMLCLSLGTTHLWRKLSSGWKSWNLSRIFGFCCFSKTNLFFNFVDDSGEIAGSQTSHNLWTTKCMTPFNKAFRLGQINHPCSNPGLKKIFTS